MIKCCKNCKERRPMCHSNCELYLAEKDEYLKMMKDWHNGRSMYEYNYDKATRIMRRLR